MLISGIQKFTLLDYPGYIAFIIFTAGCNFRCGYCHNPEFVLPEQLQKLRPTFIDENVAMRFLQKRKDTLEGVVISGGEPTMMPDLIPFIRRVKELGLRVKLDTNGSHPKVLENLFAEGLLDYVAMDLKTSMDAYKALVGPRVTESALEETRDLIVNSGVDYEFRSTLIRQIHTPAILEQMREFLSPAARLFLQTFRPGKVLCSKFEDYEPFSTEEMREIKEYFGQEVPKVHVRS